jgi:hypothetical protein
MSDLGVTKQMDGRPAKFLRFAGPDHLVIEVNAAERTITRECWRVIPLYENKQDSTRVHTSACRPLVDIGPTAKNRDLK